MNNRADETIRITLERLLSAHFEDRPYRRLVLCGPGRRDDPRGQIGVCQQGAREQGDSDEILEFRAEIRIAAPLDQERRLMDRMLEAIDILHDADIPAGCDDPGGTDAPVIVAVCLEMAAFERLSATDEAAACLVFNVRATTN